MTTKHYRLTEYRTHGNNCHIILGLNQSKKQTAYRCNSCPKGRVTLNCSDCSKTHAPLAIDLETERYELGPYVTFGAKIVSYDVTTDENKELIKLHVYVRFRSKTNTSHQVSVSSKYLALNRFYKVHPAEKCGNAWLSLYSSKSWVDPTDFAFDLELALITVSQPDPNQQQHVNQLTAGNLAMSLYEDEDTTDVELVGFGGTVRAHGNVLAAVSPVMRSAFYDCDLREKRDRRLSVPDASVRTLQIIKQFMYKGYADASPAELASVLPIASRFMLDNLARACASALTDLPPDDLIPLLRLDYFGSTVTKLAEEPIKTPCEDMKTPSLCNGPVEDGESGNKNLEGGEGNDDSDSESSS